MDKHCTFNKNGTVNRQTKNFLKQSYGELHDKFERQIARLKTKYDIVKINILWECEFMTQYPGEIEKVPLERLIPRDSVRGGRVELYELSYDAEKDKKYGLIYVDANRYCSKFNVKTFQIVNLSQLIPLCGVFF